MSLCDLQAEQQELVAALRRVPEEAPKMLAIIQQKIKDNELRISETEAKLANAADTFRKAEGDWDRLQRGWEQASESLATESSDRLKAEALRQVVEKVVVTFEATGK